VNDARKTFETRTDLYKPPAVVPVLRVSDAKKAFENTAAAAAAKPERPAAGSQGHHSLPRRTLIQTPANVISTDPPGNKSAASSNQTQQRNADKTVVVSYHQFYQVFTIQLDLMFPRKKVAFSLIQFNEWNGIDKFLLVSLNQLS